MLQCFLRQLGNGLQQRHGHLGTNDRNRTRRLASGGGCQARRQHCFDGVRQRQGRRGCCAPLRPRSTPPQRRDCPPLWPQSPVAAMRRAARPVAQTAAPPGCRGVTAAVAPSGSPLSAGARAADTRAGRSPGGARACPLAAPPVTPATLRRSGRSSAGSPPRAGGAAADWRTGAGAAAAQGPRLAHLRAERGQRRQVHGHVQELEQQKRLGLRRYPGLAQTLVDGGSDGRRGGCVRRVQSWRRRSHTGRYGMALP